MDKIDSFQGEYYFLNNSYPCFIEDKDGLLYYTVESAYQAQKTTSLYDRAKFSNILSFKAKELGSNLSVRSDWNKVKDKIMEDFVRQKFQKDPILKERLLNTKGLYLENGNDYGDQYWGTYKGKGKNKLGKILMKIRDNN